MSASPWLSVIIPVRNGERYLAEALRSIWSEGTDGYEVNSATFSDRPTRRPSC